MLGIHLNHFHRTSLRGSLVRFHICIIYAKIPATAFFNGVKQYTFAILLRHAPEFRSVFSAVIATNAFVSSINDDRHGLLIFNFQLSTFNSLSIGANYFIQLVRSPDRSVNWKRTSVALYSDVFCAVVIYMQ